MRAHMMAVPTAQTRLQSTHKPYYNSKKGLASDCELLKKRPPLELRDVLGLGAPLPDLQPTTSRTALPSCLRASPAAAGPGSLAGPCPGPFFGSAERRTTSADVRNKILESERHLRKDGRADAWYLKGPYRTCRNLPNLCYKKRESNW